MQASSVSIASGVERSRSVSSTRRRNFPPAWRAKSQLKTAARMLPMWTFPVGLGAKRTRTDMEILRNLFDGA